MPMDCNRSHLRRNCHNRNHTCCCNPTESNQIRCIQMDHNRSHTCCPFPKESNLALSPFRNPFQGPCKDESCRNPIGNRHSSYFPANKNQGLRSRMDLRMLVHRGHNRQQILHYNLDLVKVLFLHCGMKDTIRRNSHSYPRLRCLCRHSQDYLNGKDLDLHPGLRSQRQGLYCCHKGHHTRLIVKHID